MGLNLAEKGVGLHLGTRVSGECEMGRVTVKGWDERFVINKTQHHLDILMYSSLQPSSVCIVTIYLLG